MEGLLHPNADAGSSLSCWRTSVKVFSKRQENNQGSLNEAQKEESLISRKFSCYSTQSFLVFLINP